MTQPRQNLMPTGVVGLDDVLGGGLLPGHLYFLEGTPGTGKTTLGLQFVLEGARRGETCLVVSLAETASELALIAESHGWSLEGIEIRDLANIGEPVEGSALFDLSEVALDNRVHLLVGEMERLRPHRVVLDSLSGLRSLNPSPADFRRHVELFRGKAVELGCTLLVSDDLKGDEQLHPRSLAWGIIRLEQRAGDFGPARRRLMVPKLRGQDYAGGYHDLRIQTGGLSVFPRLRVEAEPGGVERGLLSSGIPALDTLLGGGLERGTSAGLIGPPGCGKSTLACVFAHAAAMRGERASLHLFDESVDTFRRRAASQGLDLDRAIADGFLSVRKVDAAELSPGELARALAHEVDAKGTRLVVIDSLNGFLQAMPSERYMSLHVHTLLGYLGSRGAVTLVTLAQPSPLVNAEGLSVDLSYVTDTVIAQRYFEAYGVIRYALSVLKKRYGDHERVIREYQIGPGGLIVGEPLAEFRGVLTGLPEYVGERKPLL